MMIMIIDNNDDKEKLTRLAIESLHSSDPMMMIMIMILIIMMIRRSIG